MITTLALLRQSLSLNFRWSPPAHRRAGHAASNRRAQLPRWTAVRMLIAIRRRVLQGDEALRHPPRVCA